METKRFDKNEVIFRRADLAMTMYEIESGAVGIYAWYGTEMETHIATFGPGDVFGEVELIESCPRAADAVALEDGTEVREISREEFADCFQDQPEKVLAIMRQVSRRVRETTRSYLEACRAVCEKVETEERGERDSWLSEHLSIFYKIGRLLKK